MTYNQWLEMNLNYEKLLLARIYDKYGKKSEQYKNKIEQIKLLKQGE